MYVDDTLEVRPGRVNCGMEHKSGHVDTKIGRSRFHDLALHVDLDQAGGCDLVVQHSKGVNEKVFCVLTDANLKNKHKKCDFLIEQDTF